MTDERPWYEEMVLPVLLGTARRTYGDAIRRALALAGFDDMPRGGARIVGAIARDGTPLRDVAAVHGTSKQAASQLVDTLVMRGYVVRSPDPDDRRRMIVTLAPRGEEAAAVVRDAVERVDAELDATSTPEEQLAARRMLAALITMGHEARSATSRA